MANSIYLFLAILALAHLIFILADSSTDQQSQKIFTGFVNFEEHSRKLAGRYTHLQRFKLISKIMSLVRMKQMTTTEAPLTENKPYLHEALYSFNRFGWNACCSIRLEWKLGLTIFFFYNLFSIQHMTWELFYW